MSKLTSAERKKVQKPLLWVGLASIVMTFAGLTSGYVVSRSALKEDNRWLEFPLPQEFLWATVLLVLSSVFLILATRSLQSNQSKGLMPYLQLTTVLGFAFAILQILGWKDLIDRGLFFTGPDSNTAISWVYVITALHWLHLISGLIVLLYTLFRASKNAYRADDHQGLSTSVTYWHFLGGLWLYLYLFLLLIR